MTVEYGAPYGQAPHTVPHRSKLRELMALVALVVSISGFVLQTVVLGFVADDGYQKPIFTMCITHSSMIVLLPLQFISLWCLKKHHSGESFQAFYLKHTSHLRQTASQVAVLNGYRAIDYWRYVKKISIILSIALNVAGASWYIAVNLTTTADLTAIYNCSTFFAYGFSVILLKERLDFSKIASVFLSVIGVFVIAYIGVDNETDVTSSWNRTLGNMIIAGGTVLYGLYEVLYKKIACPPQAVSARKQAAFANLIGSAIGLATLVLMWPVLLILHISGLETLEMPSAQVMKYLIVSIVANVAFSGSFLVLMSLTSPVLGSVGSLLATCMVPVVNYLIWGRTINFAELLGGFLIILAFGLMTWASKDDFNEEDAA